VALSVSNLLRALLHYEYYNSLNIIIFVRNGTQFYTFSGKYFYGAPCGLRYIFTPTVKEEIRVYRLQWW
jgi:hypothetical protein